LFVVCASLLSSPTVLAKAKTSPAAVAAPDTFSSDVAADILAKGGTAMDAAIAVQFALAVTLPEAGNIGGGGFMLVHTAEGNDFIDYRETAPAAAHRDMYLDENGDAIRLKSLFGIYASGTPGTVAGMWKVHQLYGTLPWADLVQPAVDLAEHGFIVPEKLANNVSRYIERMSKRDVDINFADYFGAVEAGKRFVQPELAATLKRIRDLGPKGFYEGKTAKLIADFMAKKGGLLTADDLQNYEAKQRTPIATQWRDYTLVSAPPPSSGGIAITQWLQMYDLLVPRVSTESGVTQPRFAHNSTQYIHLLAEIGKRVFADRAEYLGDPDFIDVPVHALTNSEYIAQRASDVSFERISDSEKVVAGLPESEETTHFSIIDHYGNAVSNTTTINLSFGSGVVVEGAGFLLNNEMDDFSVKPGVPNFFGAIGGEANAIAANKRMLSSMSPSIVLQDGDVRVVTGAPGGTTIITSVYQSILNVLEFGMSAQAAVDAPRFHHQLYPIDEIRHHAGLDTSVVSALTKMGYSVKERRFGDLQLIIRDGQSVTAASESHGRGKAQVLPLPQ
jgi:gamma-glutamyltranspeptidase/glutathione hydrolase